MQKTSFDVTYAPIYDCCREFSSPKPTFVHMKQAVGNRHEYVPKDSTKDPLRVLTFAAVRISLLDSCQKLEARGASCISDIVGDFYLLCLTHLKK